MNNSVKENFQKYKREKKRKERMEEIKDKLNRIYLLIKFVVSIALFIFAVTILKIVLN